MSLALYLALATPHDTNLTANTHLSPAARKVLAELVDGRASTKALARRTGLKVDTVRKALREWQR